MYSVNSGSSIRYLREFIVLSVRTNSLKHSYDKCFCAAVNQSEAETAQTSRHKIWILQNSWIPGLKQWLWVEPVKWLRVTEWNSCRASDLWLMRLGYKTCFYCSELTPAARGLGFRCPRGFIQPGQQSRTGATELWHITVTINFMWTVWTGNTHTH